MQSLMRRSGGLVGKQHIKLVESKLTASNGLSSLGSGLLNLGDGGSRSGVGISTICSNTSLNIKSSAQIRCQASCSCYRCSRSGMMMKKIHTFSVYQQPKVMLDEEAGPCSCCKCAPSGKLTNKLHTSSFLQQPKAVLGVHPGGQPLCSCSGTLMKKFHTYSVLHQPKLVLGVKKRCQASCECDSSFTLGSSMSKIHTLSGTQQQKMDLHVPTGCHSSCSCYRCSPLGIPSVFQQPKAVHNFNKRGMATVSSHVESAAQHSSMSSVNIQPRIKFKRLDKTAGHIMRILDHEAVAEVREHREIPEIKPGYIIELKVVVPENKRRVSTVKGIVIARRNAGLNSTFRLRRLVAGVGVESLFPLYSPNIKEIKIIDKKKVRRAKLYYLRDKMNALKKQ